MFLPFRAIAVFQTVARCGSVARAADVLHVTPSAVSQQVQSLEAYLGTALLVKTGRGVALTESGERYFEMIGDEVARIEEATRFIQGYRSSTTLTVRASPSLATKWLRPRLRSFLDENPGVDVRIDGTSDVSDFSREAVDVEIRHGDGRWQGLHVDGFASERFFPVCAPHYCQAGSIDALAVVSHRLIYSVKAQVQWETWFDMVGHRPSERWQKILFDRSHMAIDAAADGLGIALESDLMASGELRSGALVCPVGGNVQAVATTQWIVCPYEHLRQHKVKLFLEWLDVERAAWRKEVEELRGSTVG